MSWTISLSLHRDPPFFESSMVPYAIPDHNLTLPLLFKIRLSSIVPYYKQCYHEYIYTNTLILLSEHLYRFLEVGLLKGYVHSVWIWLSLFLVWSSPTLTEKLLVQHKELNLLVCMFPTNKYIFLHGHVTMIKIWKLTSIHYYYLFLQSHSSFYNCPNNVMFSKRIYFRSRYLYCCHVPLFFFIWKSSYILDFEDPVTFEEYGTINF